MSITRQRDGEKQMAAGELWLLWLYRADVTGLIE